MVPKMARLAFLVAVVVGVAASSPQAAMQFLSENHVNHLTFSAPAGLPGVTLAPGTYVFEAGSEHMNHNIVRVLSLNRQSLYYQGFTIPVTRRGSGTNVVQLAETAPGQPMRILAWYPAGSNSGHEFMYR